MMSMFFYIDVANTVLAILFVHFYINEVEDQNSLRPCLFIQMSQSSSASFTERIFLCVFVLTNEFHVLLGSAHGYW